MRHLAETIADDARDPGQGPPGDGGWPWSAIPVTGCYRRGKWIDGLTERTGMTRRTISRTLTDLARAGYEMREIVGRGKDGRVFTAPGHGMRFRVPRLVPRDPPERSPDTATEGRGTVAKHRDRTAGNARQIRPLRSPDPVPSVAKSGNPISPGLPQVPSDPHGPVVNSSLEGTHDRQGDDDFDTATTTAPQENPARPRPRPKGKLHVPRTDIPEAEWKCRECGRMADEGEGVRFAAPPDLCVDCAAKAEAGP